MARALSALPDPELGERLNRSPVVGSGIGGVRQVLTVDEVPVFVKRIPLTDLERVTKNGESTANLFDLPVNCQYGVGSPSFGVWREVAANTIASDLVVSGQLECFALTYHWRLMEGPLDAEMDELSDTDRLVAHWHGSSSVRRRAEAVSAATASVALFLEYIPTVLPSWLRQQCAGGDDAANNAIELVERCLLRDVPRMNTAGLFHFDAHFGNLLTDGQRVFFADLGLATSPSFALDDRELRFLQANASHDVCHTMTRFVDWLVTELGRVGDVGMRDEIISRCAAGHDHEALDAMPRAAEQVIRRYAPVAVVINDFYRKLHLEDRRTVYPTDLAVQAAQAAGLAIPSVQA